MGGEYCCKFVQEMDKDKLREEYLGIVADCQWNHGHGGYSGTFAEKPELTILNKTFPTNDEAEKFCMDNDKWGPSWAVRVEQPEPHWYIGGWCSS